MDFILIVFNLFIIPHLLPVEEFQMAVSSAYNRTLDFVESGRSYIYRYRGWKTGFLFSYEK